LKQQRAVHHVCKRSRVGRAVQALTIELDSGRGATEDLMVTRYFEQPVPVGYRTTTGLRSVLALGVRCSGDDYAVLITCPIRETRITWWVPRSEVRAKETVPR
jgi:hypothetical protein